MVGLGRAVLTLGVLLLFGAVMPFFLDRDEADRGGPRWVPQIGGGHKILYSIGWRRLSAWGLGLVIVGGLLLLAMR